MAYLYLIGVILLVALAVAVVMLRAAHANMRVLAMTDELTGIANRRAMIAQLEKLLAETSTAPLALLIIDIDYFKLINDRHGHQSGDAAIRTVARMLRNTAPESAIVARQGGEEFAVVLPNTSLDQAAPLAERFRQCIALLDSDLWQGIDDMTASIGVTVSGAQPEQPGDLLRRADNALYAAKHAGRNCVRIVTDSPIVPVPLQEVLPGLSPAERRAARQR